MSTQAHVEGFADARPRSNSTNIEPRCYRVNDACRLLQISRSHLYALVAKGEVRLIKIGGRSVIPASEIIRMTGADEAAQ